MGEGRTTLLATAVIVVTVAGGVVASHILRSDSRIEQALQTLPAQTLVVNFTDWAATRGELDPNISSASSAPTKRDFYEHAYERDFSAVSVLGRVDADMRAAYGWTVLDTEWEAYGQSRDGAVDVVQMPAGFDFSAAETALTKLGYPPADANGVRAGGSDIVATIDPQLTPQLGNIALLPDDRLIVASDSPTYAALTVQTISGAKDSVYRGDGVDSMAAALRGEAVTAVVNVGQRACVAAGFKDSGADVRRVARQRITAVGGVQPLTGLTLALDSNSELLVVMDFATAGAAASQLRPRVDLTKGEAVGQGGTFAERFRLAGSVVVDTDLVMRLRPLAKDYQLLSDLGRGGLLFASCG